jgi:glycosidase
VGEVWENTNTTAKYLQGDEFDLAFEFSLAEDMVKTVNLENANIINRQVQRSYSLLPPLQFATFLTNHDQDRLMDQLGYSPDKNKVAASLLLTAPGVPFIYYGEEIGMQGQKPDENIRRPMQWSAESNAGFSSASPWEAPGPDWEVFNVADQTDDPTSLLSHYRALIQARNQHAALRVGDLNVVTTGTYALYSILRVSQDKAVLVLVNLTGEPVSDYQLALEESNLVEGNYTPVAILGEGSFAPLSTDSSGGFSEYAPISEIPPYTTLIFQLK